MVRRQPCKSPTCRGQRSFSTQAEAQKCADKRNQVDVPLAVWRCGFCNRWHIQASQYVMYYNKARDERAKR